VWVVIYSLDRWIPSCAPCSISPPKILKRDIETSLSHAINQKEGRTSGVTIYLQPNLVSENWEFEINISDFKVLLLLAKQPKIRFFPTSPANRGSHRRNQADSRPGAAAFARLRRGCARCARLCAAAWWRAVASPTPGSGRGFNWKRESGREEGSRVQVEGKNLLQRGEKLSLRSERKGKGTFA